MTTIKYDVIGVGYDKTRRPDPRIAQRVLALLRPGPSAPGTCLDVACGTGNYTELLAETGLRITGVDHSATMLASARDKTRVVAWCQADVYALPFPDAAFGGAFCTNAVHHFTELPAALFEIGRVLRPGARLVIFTATREQMRNYWLNMYFPVALERSIVQMHDFDDIKTAIRAAGLQLDVVQPYEIPTDPVDLFLYSGKHQPQLYLDPAVRRGISTFANLADPLEVEAGIERLQRDIASGEIKRVMERFRAAATTGDYVFCAAERPQSVRERGLQRM